MRTDQSRGPAKSADMGPWSVPKETCCLTAGRVAICAGVTVMAAVGVAMMMSPGAAARQEGAMRRVMRSRIFSLGKAAASGLDASEDRLEWGFGERAGRLVGSR